MKYFVLAIALLIVSGISAQDQPVKKEKRVIVLEKRTERSVEKPSKEAPFKKEVQEDVEVMKNGEETRVRIKTVEDGKVTVREYDSLDSLPENVNVWVSEDAEGTDKQVRVRVLSSDKEHQFFEEGDELPEDVKKMLEKEGIDLDNMDGEKRIKIIRMEETEEREMDLDMDMEKMGSGGLAVETLNLNLQKNDQRTLLTVEAKVPAKATTLTVIGADGKSVFTKSYPEGFNGSIKEDINFAAGSSHRNATLLIRQGSEIFTEVLR